MKTIHLAVLVMGFFLSAFVSGAQPATFLTNGLIDYYPFNGTANDASGNGNNGVLTGTSFVTDRFGVAASALQIPFGGQMAAPLNYDSEPTNAVTISVWANLSSLTGQYPTIARLNRQTGSFSPLIDFNVATRQFDGFVTINTYESSTIAMPQSPQTNQWYCFALTFSNGLLSFYNNGVLIGQTNFTPTVSYSVSPDTLTIGSAAYPIEYLDGIVDDLRIYNRALSVSEVAQLFAIESSPPLSVVKAVTVQDYGLTVGSNYLLQSSVDLTNWTNQGSVFTATSSYWLSTNFWFVGNWNQLFFRLVPQ